MKMRNLFLSFALMFTLAGIGSAESTEPKPQQTSITVYNGGFGLVRETVPMRLQAGETHFVFSGATAHIEPDSVILRDPLGKREFQILEQNYRNDPVTQERLLSLFEGQTIDFLIMRNGEVEQKVSGKVIRSGYVPNYAAANRYGQQYYPAQMAYANQSTSPIIEVGGKLQFFLPGQPLFPTLGDDSILRPRLEWLLQSPGTSEGPMELSYITGGMAWRSSYNIVAPEKGDTVDIVGWVTMDNQTGRDFRGANIRLMAGDVNKINPNQLRDGRYDYAAKAAMMEASAAAVVTEKTFDEFHLYTLERPTTLRDRETKQVEFVRATGVKSQRLYVYDGAMIDNRWFANPEYARNDQSYGTQSNPKIWVMQEFKNTKENSLGIPLPAGQLRFYRRDSDGQLQFTGENMIDHTPTDETVRVYTGNSFDIVGERTRTDYKIDTSRDWLDESFTIKLRNHKKEPVTVRVVEHLYRWVNWQIVLPSQKFTKKDSRTIEFAVTLPPDSEKVVTYTAHYTW
jgi:hypothetical protein